MSKISSEEFKRRALAEISPTPFERLSPSVQELISTGNFYFDNHIHIFDEESVPAPYRNLHMLELNLQLTQEERIKAAFEGRLNKEIAHLIDRIRQTLPIANREEILKFYLEKIAFQDKPVICTTLMMDMEYGWKNPLEKPISAQIDEEKKLLEKGYAILPFFAVDPRRADDETENLYGNFLKAFTGDYSFFGVKIYPSMGYMPSDPRLFPVYEICERLNIPVTSHCGGNFIGYADKCIHIKGLEIKNGETLSINNTICGSYVAKAKFLNHPFQWLPVLEKFPKLRLNLAHFGGSFEWKELGNKPTPRIDTIIAYMHKFPYLYTDFSYNVHSRNMNEKLNKLALKVSKVQERTLFGTDYYVVMAAARLNLKRRVKNFKGTNLPFWYNFSHSNPLRFYGLDSNFTDKTLHT